MSRAKRDNNESKFIAQEPRGYGPIPSFPFFFFFFFLLLSHWMWRWFVWRTAMVPFCLLTTVPARHTRIPQFGVVFSSVNWLIGRTSAKHTLPEHTKTQHWIHKYAPQHSVLCTVCYDQRAYNTISFKDLVSFMHCHSDLLSFRILHDCTHPVTSMWRHSRPNFVSVNRSAMVVNAWIKQGYIEDGVFFLPAVVLVCVFVCGCCYTIV